MRCRALLALILLVAPFEALAQQLDTIQFSRTSYSVFENSGPIAIEIERAGPLTDFGTAWMQTMARTASEGDFVLFDDMITFEPGQSNLTVMIGIANDILVEGAEWFDVVLSSPDPFCCRLGSNTVATITIEDNDLAVRFSSGYHFVAEDAGELLVEVFRFEDMTNESAAFTFEIEDRSARRNMDFTILTNVVTFSPGQTNAIIRMGILNDAVPEEVEEFVLRFGPNPDFPCCGLGSPETLIVIVDNDRGVEFSAPAYSVPEESGDALITLTREGDVIANAGDVTISINQISATASIDFDLPSLEFSLHFAVGQSNLTFAVRIINDALVEGPELFSLELVADESNLALGSQLGSEVLILDNDFGIEFARSIYEAREGEHPQTLEIQVQRIGDATQAFSVDVLIAGNATLGGDFILPAHQLHFADGQTNLAVLIAVPDDPFVEGKEFVDLFLLNATANVPLGSNSIARIYLHDNEIPVNMVDPAFIASETSGLVTAALVQLDGRIVVASPLRRLHPEGSLDLNFAPTLSGVSALAMQPDGKIVCAGTFRFFAGGQFQNCLARYNSDGTRDVFSSPLSFESKVRWIQVQADGKILIGGKVLSDSDGSMRGIARLESWGAWDSSFNIPADVFQVDAAALQPDGKIIIGGPFSLVGGRSRAGLARLWSDGALDESFDAADLGAGAAVCALALQQDGKVLAAVSSNRVVRLSGIDGALDPAFQTQTGTNSSIERVILQPDGKILLLGDIFGSDNNRVGAIVRLNADGSFDPGFSSAIGGIVIAWHGGRVFTAYDGKLVQLLPETPASSFSLTATAFYLTEAERGEAVLLQRRGNSGSTLAVDFATGGDAVPGQDYLPGGGTMVFQPLEVTKPVISHVINDCRTESNETVVITLTNAAPGAQIGSPEQATLLIIDDDTPGGLDDFNPSLEWVTFPTNVFYSDDVPNGAFGLQPDGKIVVTRDGAIARVNPDGSQDTSFANGASICAKPGRGLIIIIGNSSCRVNAIAVTPSGHILAAGLGSILKLDPNGVIDPTFVVDAVSFGSHGAMFSANVNELLLQPDGKILVTGDFMQISGFFGNPARLNPDSTVDTSFRMDSIGWRPRLALLPDGKLIAASGASLVRLSADGSRDEIFSPVHTTGDISVLKILPDQKILIGGSFARVNNEDRPHLARLDPDGSLDANFNPGIGVDVMAIQALAVSEQGDIFVAARFANGTTRIVKLNSDGILVASFNSGLHFAGPAFFDAIKSIVEQPSDGMLLVAGNFQAVASIARNGLARLTSERSHIQLFPPRRQPDGSLRIVSGSQMGATYTLQRSADLEAWTSVTTNRAGDCAVEFTDPSPSPDAGFYRVIKTD